MIFVIQGENMQLWLLRALSGTLIAQSAFASHMTIRQFQAKMRTQLSSLSRHTNAGVHIEVLGSGKQLFSHRPDNNLMPASASKLITTAAAFGTLGPQFQYETKVLMEGKDLILMSSGDPYILNDSFTTLASDVARAGLRHVHTIRINNSAYAEDYTGLSQFANWDAEDDASVISATSFNYNVLRVYVTPASHATHPSTSIGPVASNAYPIIHNLVTQVNGSGNNITVHPAGMSGNQEVFELRGTIGRQAAMVEVHASVRLPEANVAYAFAGLLRDHGVSVDQEYGGLSFSPPDTAAQTVVSLPSLTLRELANIYMPASINFMAEAVFQTFGSFELGGQASIKQSEAAMSRFLSRYASCQFSHMENGSGLTWNNEVSPHCFIEMLQSLYEENHIYDDLIASLPVGGKSGTLEDRFQNAPSGFVASRVHAKTGTLWSKKVVTALIGQTEIASGQKVLFALMENDDRAQESLLQELKNWEDSCVEALQELWF